MSTLVEKRVVEEFESVFDVLKTAKLRPKPLDERQLEDCKLIIADTAKDLKLQLEHQLADSSSTPAEQTVLKAEIDAAVDKRHASVLELLE